MKNKLSATLPKKLVASIKKSREKRIEKAIKNKNFNFEFIRNEITEYVLARSFLNGRDLKEESTHIMLLTAKIINNCSEDKKTKLEKERLFLS